MIKSHETLANRSCESFHKQTFRKRTGARAEPTEADDPPESEPIAVEPTVTPALVELGEAHFWPHATMAGDLSSPGATKIVTRGDGVWVYDERGHRYFDTLSGMWLNNIGHGRREVADAVYAQICELGYAPDGSVHPSWRLCPPRMSLG
jgi:4-aminobutyrate aminotransferase-like enzyme